MAGRGIAKIELSSYDRKFQDPLHFQEDENSAIKSIYYREPRPMTWNVKRDEKLPSTENEDKVSYKINTSTYHFLLSTQGTQQLPALRIRQDKLEGKDVQIAWCHNLGNNICVEGHLEIDKKQVQTVTGQWNDQCTQFLTDQKCRHSRQEDLGNVPYLQNWSTELPAETVSLKYNWEYQKHESKALPLLYCRDMEVQHVFVFRRRISELLRMRARKSATTVVEYVDRVVVDENGEERVEKVKQERTIPAGPWKDMPVSLKYIEGVDATGKLPVPSFTGYYGLVSESEENVLYGKGDTPEDKQMGDVRRIYWENIVVAKEDTPVTLGETRTVGIDSSTPVKGYFFCAENILSKKFNNHSNYSTNSEDFRKGHSPIKRIERKYGEELAQDFPMRHHTNDVPERNGYPCIPFEPGYGTDSFYKNIMSIDGDTALKLPPKTKLVFHTEDTDPMLTLKKITSENIDDEDFDRILQGDQRQEEIETKNRSQFTLYVFLMVLRKLTFVKKTQECTDNKQVYKLLIDEDPEDKVE